MQKSSARFIGGVLSVKSVVVATCKWGRSLPLKMAEFQGLVTLTFMTLTLDWVILHTVMHHSSTSTYKPISLKLKKLFLDGQTF